MDEKVQRKGTSNWWSSSFLSTSSSFDACINAFSFRVVGEKKTLGYPTDILYFVSSTATHTYLTLILTSLITLPQRSLISDIFELCRSTGVVRTGGTEFQHGCSRSNSKTLGYFSRVFIISFLKRIMGVLPKISFLLNLIYIMFRFLTITIFLFL